MIQFLVHDCKFDPLPTWRDAVLRERAEWRKIQTRSVTWAWPEVAAAQLEEMGYQVTPPQEGHTPPSEKTLESW